MVNLGETAKMGLWNDGNESNALIDDPSEDDVDVNEDALANDMTLGNIPTIISPTSSQDVPLILDRSCVVCR